MGSAAPVGGEGGAGRGLRVDATAASGGGGGTATEAARGGGGGSSRGVVPRAVLFFMSWPRVGEGEQAREPALSIQLRKCTYVGIRT